MKALKALYGVGGFDLVGLVVDDDQFDGAVEDGRFELVGKLDAFEFKLPAESVLAGQGQILKIYRNAADA